MSKLNTYYPRNSVLYLIVFLVFTSHFSTIYATSVYDSMANTDFHISGTITDVSTMAVISNAKISLLDPVSGDVLVTDIYTDENGIYDVNINLDDTSVPVRSVISPSSYFIGEFSPNPVVPRYIETVTLKYQVPNNVPEIPSLEMYNITGKKINHKAFLASGIYSCRLEFKNGHIAETKKMVLTSSGFLNILLNQEFVNTESTLRKTKADVRFKKKAVNSTEVLFLIEKNGYASMERSCQLLQDINNARDFSLVQIYKQSIATLDTAGGIITVTNSRNDSITLTIPRYALWEPTEITLTSFSALPNNPIGENIFPGVSISPAGFRPHRPVNLKVNFAAADIDTSFSTLFYIKQSDYVLPLGKLAITDSTMEGYIFHFSDYSAGDPSEDEAIGQANKAEEGGSLNPNDWQGTYDVVEALIKWAEILTRFGKEAEAEAVLTKVKEIIERDAGNFINQAVPENPCGWYKNVLIKFGDLVFSKLVSGNLVTQYSDRIGEIYNRCGIQGDIECLYEIESEAGAYYEKWVFTGDIPFSSTGSESHVKKLSGAGKSSVDVKGFGRDCIISGNGSNTITIGGELAVDNQGDFWLDVIWKEDWWTTSNITLSCPDAPSIPYSQPKHTDENLLRFIALDGAIVQRPGGFKWILHLYNLFND